MNVDTINKAAQSGLGEFFDFLPQLLGAIVIFVIGWVVASILKRVVQQALQMARFDKFLLESPGRSFIERVFNQPSGFVGSVVYWLVLLGFLSLALSSLNIEGLNDFMGAVYAYLPHVVAALLIFLASSAVSVAAVTVVRRLMGQTALANMVATVVPSIVMSITMFMILNELMIAKEIVNITYTALVGSVALGMALAFGLGGRDVAARLLEQAYQSGQAKAAMADRSKTEVRRARKNSR